MLRRVWMGVCAWMLALVLSATAFAQAASPESAPRIAAASDLSFALDEIAERYTADTGRKVTLVFGASGNLFRQISQGAPFEMFLSADESFVSQLAAAGRTDGEGDLYAFGRLVLFAPKGSPLNPSDGMTGLARALADGKIRRFAIANPEHAPYGRAAKQALEANRLWDSVQPQLVLGENVAQAAQFAMAGGAQGGLFSYSLTFTPEVAKAGAFALVPLRDHAPLRQRMVLMRDASTNARAFYAYMQTAAARDVLKRHGFTLPEDAS